MAPNFGNAEDNALADAIERKSGGTVTGTGTCRSCSARIFWVRLPSGKNAPYDSKPYEKDGQPVNHFATCPNAKAHRPQGETKG